MQKFYLIVSILLFYSCNNTKTASIKTKKEVIIPEFQSIIDTAKVNGAILVYDLKKDVYYSNDFKWIKKGKLPASTFKIANSIIALETNVVKNDSTLFKWDGEKRNMAIWEQDLILKEAFHYSCVPCYQKIAKEIGVKRMKRYLEKLNYGDIILDSTSIDNFWLEGASKINQLQQIDFLKRFYQSKLPITNETTAIMKRLMLIDETFEYKISGKTGWSIKNGNNNGWFVGYVELKENIYFFATNISPKENFDMKKFPAIRKQITLEALKALDIIKLI